MSPWESITRRDYAPEIAQVRQILERIVLQDHDGGHISYIAVLREIPGLPRDIEGQHVLWRILGCVSIDTHGEGMGMLSVIVWNEENQPGSGFYDVATRDCGWPPSASEEEIFSEELRRVYESFSAR